MNCDLCGKPVEDGQPRRGGNGDGGKTGAPLGFARHYSCHVERYGRSPSTSLQPEIQALRKALGAPPAEPLGEGPKAVKRSLVPSSGSTYNRSENAARVWRNLRRLSEMGHTRIEIECPFCFARFWANVWSLSGGGKKCPNCGSMHASFGNAYPLMGNEDL
jgi:hypothetical protein